MSQRTIFDAFKKANSRSMNMQAGTSQLRDEVRPQSWNAMMHTLFGSDDEIDVSDVDINEEEMLYVDTNVSPHGLEGAIECSAFVDESDTAEIQRENVKPLKRGKS
ncbi:hypothetical protein L7F22_033565 [Adiantum nelumboides]|nr:hypothetical protein [Adiantum nelumboides]